MAIFFITLGVLALVIVGMSAGVLSGRGPLKGSCGGLGAVGIDSKCDICGGNPKKCEDSREEKNTSPQEDISYDASKK